MISRRPGARFNRGRVPDKLPDFLPTSISGLVWWLRADKGITLNGSNVSAWADQSGAGDSARNAAQSTSGNQPAFNSANSSYGNKPTIDFTAASSHYLINSGAWASSYAAPFTIGFVGHSSAAPAGAVCASSGDYNDLWANTPAGDKTRHTSGAAGANVIYTSRTITSAGIVLAAVDGAASSAIYVSRKTSSASIAGTPAGSLGAVAMNIGRRQVGAIQYWNGTIAEVFAWSRALTSTEVGLLMDYAVRRYGITLS